ncbi:hypothetical protein [Clostridium cuniculi]|uniref:hypothetical protein n=1 Tax=Clostridium cuniculi TaxID=2548455 RepID=UPI0010549136|nr:hypothetical protein [Clostridium cuniculi]
MEVKKSKMLIVMIGFIAIIIIGTVLLKKNVIEKANIKEVVSSVVDNDKADNSKVDNDKADNSKVDNDKADNSKVDNDKADIKEVIERKIEKYVKENGKEYSNEVISGENSFFVGGIGKSIKSYNLEKFNPEDFDIYGLIESVPESCDKFGSEVIIDDEDITVNLYTEKDKFYEDE